MIEPGIYFMCFFLLYLIILTLLLPLFDVCSLLLLINVIYGDCSTDNLKIY